MAIEQLFAKSDAFVDKVITVDGEDIRIKVKEVGNYHVRAMLDDLASADRETRITAGNKVLALTIHDADGEKAFTKADDLKKLKPQAHRELIRVFTEVNSRPEVDEELKNG